MKLIREARMGRPKQFKSGAILATYPKPMLYYGLDRGGIDVLPHKDEKVPQGYIQPDTFYEEIVTVTGSNAFAEWSQKPKVEQPRILQVDFTKDYVSSLDLMLKPTSNQVPYTQFIQCHNQLANRTELPWQTVVLDGATGFLDIALMFIASVNPGAMIDARQWASMAGGMLRRTILAMSSLPCHFVCILHSTVEKNELTGEINETPNVYSQMLRDDFFGLFSQVFYALKKQDGRPYLQVSDQYPVKGIGPRWPLGLSKEVEPDFKSIYGTVL